MRQAMVEIFDVLTKRKIKAEVILADKSKLPLKKDGWNFNWNQLRKTKGVTTYILKLMDTPHTIEGVLQVKIEGEMFIMDLNKIAPHTIGLNKRYEFVAEYLILFACRESFKIEGDYKGYLTFIAKTDLIDWYASKYGAIQAMGQRMFISPQKGLELQEKYMTN